MYETDPDVMSTYGLIAVIVWGLAYISVYKSYTSVKWLVGIFVIAKIAIVTNWVLWLMNNDLQAVYDQDWTTGVFFNIYGIIDGVFMLFFVYVFAKLMKN